MASQIKFRPWQATVGGVQKTVWVPSSDIPDSIGGGGGSNVQKMYINQDNGPTLLCTSIPPSDFTLLAVSVNAAGTGYGVGQILNVAGGTVDGSIPNNISTVKVTSVGATGTILGVSVNNPGAYTIKPATPQTINSAGGVGGSINLVFGNPIPVAMQKPPELRTDLASDYYKGVTYNYTYTPSAASDAGHPVGNPGFVYYSMAATGSDGSSANFEITPPYMYGKTILAVTLSDGSLWDLNVDGRAWAQP
jgi:hypothetical protein